MTKLGYGISVFFPAYNEEENIGDLVLTAYRYLRRRFEDFEILVISEGSTDRTKEIVLSLSRSIPSLRLLYQPRSFGYAGALRTGFRNARKELVFYTDGDNQFDINELDKLIPLIETHGVVTGYKIKRHDPPVRRWASWLYNLAMRLFFGLRLRDINCAFKLYRREVIEKIDFIPSLTQGVINAEIYVNALANGYKIAEVGVNHYPRVKGVSGAELGRTLGFVKPKIIWLFLKDTLSLWTKIHLRKN